MLHKINSTGDKVKCTLVYHLYIKERIQNGLFGMLIEYICIDTQIIDNSGLPTEKEEEREVRRNFLFVHLLYLNFFPAKCITYP